MNPVSTWPLMNSGCSATRLMNPILVFNPTIYISSVIIWHASTAARVSNLILFECTAESTQRIISVLTTDDQLGNHRIIMNTDFVALREPSLDTDIR